MPHTALIYLKYHSAQSSISEGPHSLYLIVVPDAPLWDCWCNYDSSMRREQDGTPWLEARQNVNLAPLRMSFFDYVGPPMIFEESTPKSIIIVTRRYATRMYL